MACTVCLQHHKSIAASSFASDVCASHCALLPADGVFMLPAQPGPLLRAALDGGAVQLLERWMRQAGRSEGNPHGAANVPAQLLDAVHAPTYRAGKERWAAWLAALLAHCPERQAAALLATLCKANKLPSCAAYTEALLAAPAVLVTPVGEDEDAHALLALGQLHRLCAAAAVLLLGDVQFTLATAVTEVRPGCIPSAQKIQACLSVL
jgi:hypothetical protein